MRALACSGITHFLTWESAYVTSSFRFLIWKMQGPGHNTHLNKVVVVDVQLPSCVWFFTTPWTEACQPSLSLNISQSLSKFMFTALVMSSNLLILWYSFPLPSFFSRIRVFSNELAVHIRWPKYWCFSISPSNEYSGLISLLSKGLSRVFSSTTVQKCQFFGALPSLRSNSHNCAWLLERP